MAIGRQRCRLGVFIGLWCAALAPAEDFPRFEFQTGDYYVYQRRERVTGADNADSAAVQQIRLWCLHRTDESARLLLELSDAVDRRAVSRGALVLTADRRGRLHIAEPYDSQLDTLAPALELFAEFPHFLHSSSDWSGQPDRFGLILDYHDRGPDASFHGHRRVDFEQRDPSRLAEVVGRSRRGTLWFNPQWHVITRRIETRNDGASGDAQESELLLYKKGRVDRDWLRRREPELRRFAQTLTGAARIRAQMLEPGGDGARSLDRLVRLWRDYRISVLPNDDSPLRAAADAQLRRLRERGGDLREQATLAHRWLAAPAAHWSLQDSQGNTLRSEDVRTTTTLEVFWSVRTPAALFSIASLDKLRSHYSNERLRIACINVDRDPQLARRIASLSPDDIVHVFAGPPVGGELPRILPIWRVLDRESRVLRIAFGWQRDPVALIEPFAASPEESSP